MGAWLLYIAFICLLWGVVYPVLAILYYPLYKLFGGDQVFSEYVRTL